MERVKLLTFEWWTDGRWKQVVRLAERVLVEGDEVQLWTADERAVYLRTRKVQCLHSALKLEVR